ncbi:hypothetical protein UFOVP80_64 [uncultured Caudovirales phage]|jgi:hypothetical protein|uniref:Uncharacterized protein n=1 Tax=uncultured Caudovirales phage TaxID=2100421 RepID=A0A6J5KXV6_9CAUD|nr:hypothetical protein UFOVP80_64 [uncultured Caudovirales phage]
MLEQLDFKKKAVPAQADHPDYGTNRRYAETWIACNIEPAVYGINATLGNKMVRFDHTPCKGTKAVSQSTIVELAMPRNDFQKELNAIYSMYKQIDADYRAKYATEIEASERKLAAAMMGLNPKDYKINTRIHWL